MGKLGIAIAAALIGAAAVLGAVAVTRTVSLGARAPRSADAAIRARAKQLNAFEASLRRERARKPPPLPALPKPVAMPTPAAPRVVYSRPAPIVVVRHTHHGDDGGGEGADAEGRGGD
jgi:hypothetical protein